MILKIEMLMRQSHLKMYFLSQLVFFWIKDLSFNLDLSSNHVFVMAVVIINDVY